MRFIAAALPRGPLAAGLLVATLLLPAPAHAQRMEFARAGAVSSSDGMVRAAAALPDAARGRKNGFIAFGLGYLFPGAGHFYAGDSWRGANILGAVIGGFMFASSTDSPSTAGAASLVSTVVYLWSMIDAPLAAGRHNRRLVAMPRPIPGP